MSKENVVERNVRENADEAAPRMIFWEVGYGLPRETREAASKPDRWLDTGERCANGHPIYRDVNDRSVFVDVGCDAELMLASDYEAKMEAQRRAEAEVDRLSIVVESLGAVEAGVPRHVQVRGKRLHVECCGLFIALGDECRRCGERYPIEVFGWENES